MLRKNESILNGLPVGIMPSEITRQKKAVE